MNLRWLLPLPPDRPNCSDARPSFRCLPCLINGDTTGHLQSIIVGAILLIGAIQVAVLGVVADLIHGQRVVSERILHRVRDVGNDLDNAQYLLDDPESR